MHMVCRDRLLTQGYLNLTCSVLTLHGFPSREMDSCLLTGKNLLLICLLLDPSFDRILVEKGNDKNKMTNSSFVVLENMY